MSIKEFKSKMNEVAARNDDEFKTTCTVDETGTSIEVTETADNHTFLQGHGGDVEHAIADAMKNLADALAHWGYE